MELHNGQTESELILFTWNKYLILYLLFKLYFLKKLNLVSIVLKKVLYFQLIKIKIKLKSIKGVVFDFGRKIIKLIFFAKSAQIK